MYNYNIVSSLILCTLLRYQVSLKMCRIQHSLTVLKQKAPEKHTEITPWASTTSAVGSPSWASWWTPVHWLLCSHIPKHRITAILTGKSLIWPEYWTVYPQSYKSKGACNALFLYLFYFIKFFKETGGHRAKEISGIYILSSKQKGLLPSQCLDGNHYQVYYRL